MKRPMQLLTRLTLTALLTLAGCSDESTDAADTTQADAALDAATSDTATDASTCTPSKRAEAPATLDAERPATVYLPKDWDGCKPYPLVILLHGYSANGVIQNAYLGLSARVDSHGFVLLVPEGSKAPNGNQFWNATNACCDFYNQGIDDVGYIRGLITAAKAQLAVDPERVYLFGHSNGGFMSYRMACEASDLVTGIVSLAGAVTATAASCTPTQPVNVLQIHGTKDKTIKYLGDQLYPSAEQAIARWRTLDNCKGAPSTMAAIDFDNAATGAETTGQSWNSCDQGTQVGLWTMQDSGHIPGFNDAFRDAVLDHLLAFQRK